MSSPVPAHARRRTAAQPQYSHAAQAKSDLRWDLLDLVRECRKALGLRDRDIAVLRGLLSLISDLNAPDAYLVFASNRVLIERCDGIDERTLRRRLAHLQDCDLLCRRSSPNGKRYRLRNGNDEVCLSYGIDLTPLFAKREELQSLAKSCRQDAAHCKVLRAKIRDLLFHHGERLAKDIHQMATRCLRRVMTADALRRILDFLNNSIPDRHTQTHQVTVSDSQNDRHIQNSNTETYESESNAEKEGASTEKLSPDDISVEDCVEMAPNAAAFAPKPAQSWSDIETLSLQLAPAIGLGSADVAAARTALGPLGSALAVLGLVEAFDRIRNPQAYLHKLVCKARTGGIDLLQMFRSLTRPVGMRECLPG